MTYPTDDELEAMAARLYSDGDAEPAHPLFYEAAAMLRACKGRDAALLRECAGREVCWCGETSPEAQADCPLKGCSLEPAPDHAEWDAAIEAAAKEIDCGCDGACMWPHACPKEDIEAIRALKKGPRHD